MVDEKLNETIEIISLEFPESIHKRSGMYIGSNKNPDVIVREPIDNCLDEAGFGYCNKIHINTKSSYVVIADNGRGLPVYNNEKDEPIVNDILTKLHTGGKFAFAKSVDKEVFSLGLNGVGCKASNALSEDYIVVINVQKSVSSAPNKEYSEMINSSLKDPEDSPFFIIHYKDGYFQKSFITEPVGITDYLASVSKDIKLPDNFTEFSTIVVMKPSQRFFETTKVTYDIRELKLSKLLNPEVNIIFNGDSISKFDFKTDSMPNTDFFAGKTFSFDVTVPAHLWDKVVTSNEQVTVMTPTEYDNFNPISKFKVFFGFSNTDFSMVTDGSVNKLETKTGAHINKTVDMIGKALSDRYNTISPNDVKFGLRSFVLFFGHNDVLNYSGQTKERLGSIRAFNDNVAFPEFKKQLTKLMKDEEAYFDALVVRLNEYKLAIGKMSQKDFVNATVIYGDDKRSRGLGVAIAECSSKNREECELFITEGKSAGGNLKQARDTRIHAILPLKGKVLNSSDSELEDALKNPEILSMINGIGVGVHPYVDLSKRRYGKVIIASDADVDGNHISALILGAFATHLPEVIDSGLLYIGLAPLFEQDGKYIWDESEVNKSKHFNRYKGLGSCSPKVLKDTLIDKSTRRLVRVTNDNIDKALELLRSSYSRKLLMIENGIFDSTLGELSEDDLNYLSTVDEESRDRLENEELL